MGREEDVRHGLVRGVEGGGADGHAIHVGDGGGGEAAARPLRLHGDVNVGGPTGPVSAL